MSRKTSRQLGALLAAEKLTNPAAVAVLHMATVGTDKGLKFEATVGIGATTYDLASDSGKVARFSDVDGFIKRVAKFAEDGNGVYQVTVNTGALLASSVPANIVTANAAKAVSLGKVKTNQESVLADLDGQILLMAGWDTGNAAQRAKLTETQTQRAVVAGDIAEIVAEIATLQG